MSAKINVTASTLPRSPFLLAGTISIICQGLLRRTTSAVVTFSVFFLWPTTVREHFQDMLISLHCVRSVVGKNVQPLLGLR
jgi:hypothetical protein